MVTPTELEVRPRRPRQRPRWPFTGPGTIVLVLLISGFLGLVYLLGVLTV